MKESIRRGVFETNSSSTHSLTLCSKDEFERWRNGELYFGLWEGDFITKEEYERERMCECDDYEDCDCDREYYTYAKYWDYVGGDYETFKEERGDTIAFGYYGYN